jgi:hypothetical protein
MKKTMKKLLLILFTVSASPAWAATYHVATTGTAGDGASCGTAQNWSVGTPANAKTTINGGLGCVGSPGDILYIHSGTYDSGSGFIYILSKHGSSGSPILISRYPSDPEDSVIVTGTSTNIVAINDASYVTVFNIVVECTNLTNGNPNVRGNCVQTYADFGTPNHIILDSLTIKNAGRAAGNYCVPEPTYVCLQHVSSLQGSLDDSQLLNCKIFNGGNSNFDHGIYLTGDRVTMDGCRIYHNAGLALQRYPTASSGWIIKNSEIYENGYSNVDSGGAVWGGGLFMYGGTGDLLYNNLTYGNYGSGIYCVGNEINCSVFNNTVYGNIGSGNAGIRIDPGSSGICSNNLTIDNGGGGITGCSSGGNNRDTGTAASHFINAATGDFRLMMGSSAIDAGANLATSPPCGICTDKVGVTRVVPWDIGAYEFGNVITPPNTPPLEDFVYTTGSALVGAAGGTNWTGPWQDAGCGGSGFTIQTAPADSFSGGNAATSTSTTAACVSRAFTAVGTGSIIWQMRASTTTGYHVAVAQDAAGNESAILAMQTDGHIHSCTTHPTDTDLGPYNANQSYLFEANFDAVGHPFNVRYRINEGTYTAWEPFCVQQASASLVDHFIVLDNDSAAHTFSFDTIGAKSTAVHFSSEPPATVTSGVAFSTTVDVVYSDGLTKHANATDMISIAICTGSPAATLTGTTNLAATAGAATFNLTLTQPAGAVGVTLCATASNLVGDESIPITIPNAITPVTAIPALVRARIRAR